MAAGALGRGRHVASLAAFRTFTAGAASTIATGLSVTTASLAIAAATVSAAALAAAALAAAAPCLRVRGASPIVLQLGLRKLRFL